MFIIELLILISQIENIINRSFYKSNLNNSIYKFLIKLKAIYLIKFEFLPIPN